MESSFFYHKPIMLRQCIDALSIKKDGIYVDATTGGGGHSIKIANCLFGGTLICIDRDEEAINYAKAFISTHNTEGGKNSIFFENDNFVNLKQILTRHGVNKIDGILMDLGVSSRQIDAAERGFSYIKNAPLDMRMDKRQQLSAYNVVNDYSESELVKIMFEYGEERFSKKIAANIIEQRQIKPIETTIELVKIIESSVPKSKRAVGSHPAKRVFQAVRIEVNSELDNLYSFILELPDIMNQNGKIAVMAFHSLEDRIIKKAFYNMQNPCTCPHNMPMCVCLKKSSGRIVNKKPIVPNDEEVNDNPRAKSAKLRVFEIGGDLFGI